MSGMGTAGELFGVALAGVGALIAQGKYDEAQQLRVRIAQQYGEQALPQFDQLVAEQIAASPVDDATRQRQLHALEALDSEYRSGGQTEGDKAALNLARQQVAGHESSRFGSMQQALAQRGQRGNTALEAAAAQTSGQNAANALGMQSEAAQASARDRALHALDAEMGGAGQMRGQDMARASHMDSINQYNADNRMRATQYNNAQRQLGFENQLTRRDRMSNAQLGVANGLQSEGDRARAMWAGIGQGFATQGKSFGEFSGGGGGGGRGMSGMGGGGGPGFGGGGMGSVGGAGAAGGAQGAGDSGGFGFGLNPDEEMDWGSWG